MLGWIGGSDHILGQICRSDQFFIRSHQITLCQICLSDQIKSNPWFRSYLVGYAAQIIYWVTSNVIRSDLLVSSLCGGSACQIRLSRSCGSDHILVGCAFQIIVGQICWSDQLVRSGKSDLWFSSYLVGPVVQIMYWVRSAGKISFLSA